MGKNSNEAFKKFREGKDRHIDFSSNSIEEYNLSIKLKELKNILKTSKDTAPGGDELPYIMIRQLSEESLKYLLDFYNLIFREHIFPESWKEAIIIPILKVGKDATKCDSYRPIALISCLSKILEKILNKRLMWYLEKHNLINKSQCGFRKGRGTTDHLTRLTSDIQEALVNNEYHISVFLDLMKAYDTVWKQVILEQLQKFNMKGHLACYIQNFLQDRSIKVKVGNCFSEIYDLDLGVPQGSSISVTLFLIAINTIFDYIPSKLEMSLFVDDCRFSIRTKMISKDTEKELQNILNILETWASKTGFKFAEGKSEILICTRKICPHNKPPNLNLFIDKLKLKVVTEKKFLGVWFDWRMLWNIQLQHLKDKSIRDTGLLKTLAFSKTKTDTKMLLRIYQTMLLPKLDYGCLAYGTATTNKIGKYLDPIHHNALRLCLGAFRTTAKESLYAESNLHSLFYRRKILRIKYYARTLTINKDNTVCNLSDRRRDQLFRNSKRFETPAMTIRFDMAELGIKFPPICEQKVSKIPPWIMPNIEVCFDMQKVPKNSSSSPEILAEFWKHKHTSDIDIYTDGSKTRTGVGAGIAILNNQLQNQVGAKHFSKAKKSLNGKANILSAELTAISVALDYFEKLSNNES